MFVVHVVVCLGFGFPGGIVGVAVVGLIGVLVGGAQGRGEVVEVVVGRAHLDGQGTIEDL